MSHIKQTKSNPLQFPLVRGKVLSLRGTKQSKETPIIDCRVATAPRNDNSNTKNQKLKIKNYFAFTLVELIVVIVILAILATIAFLSFNSYSSSSRDSVRLSDINSLKKSLEMYNITGGAGYPLPDSNTGVTFSGAILWYQGTIGDGVSRILSTNLSKKPIDPLINNEYTYSLLGNKREFQIKANLESGKIGYNNINGNNGVNNSIPHLTPAYRQVGPFNLGEELISSIFPLTRANTRGLFEITNTANAASTGATTCYINGNFNGLLDSTKDSSNTNYILAVPSLILTDPTNASNTTFTGGNLSKMGSGILQCNGQNDPCVINYNSSNIIYTGTPTTTTQALTIAQNLQQAYSGSNITTLPAVQNILTSTGDALTNISAGVLKNSAGINNLHDCPMGDDWNGTGCVPDSKTVLLMHFDNSLSDTMSPSRTITNNGVTFTGGQFSRAAYFNGSNYIDSPLVSDWNFSNQPFTIDTWVYATSFNAAYPSNYVPIVSAGRDGGGAYSGWGFTIVDQANPVLQFSIATTGWVGVSYPYPNFHINEWHHVAISSNGSSMKFFGDGVLLGTRSHGNIPVGVGRNFRIGQFIYNTSTPNLSGYLDELKIVKGKALWNSDFSGSLPNKPY